MRKRYFESNAEIHIPRFEIMADFDERHFVKLSSISKLTKTSVTINSAMKNHETDILYNSLELFVPYDRY